LTGYSITFDMKSGERSYLAGVISSVSVYRRSEGARDAITGSRTCTQSGLYPLSLGGLPGTEGFACQLRLPRTYLAVWRQGSIVSSLRVSSFSGELDGADVIALALRQAKHVTEAT